MTGFLPFVAGLRCRSWSGRDIFHRVFIKMEWTGQKEGICHAETKADLPVPRPQPAGGGRGVSPESVGGGQRPQGGGGHPEGGRAGGDGGLTQEIENFSYSGI